MKGYISAVRDDDGTVQFTEIGDGIGIYRNDDGSNSICARTNGRDIDLEFRDRSVSRMREAGAPIRIEPARNQIVIRNVDNASKLYAGPVGVGTKSVLERGDSERITDDTVVELGFETTVLVSVENDASMSDEQLTERTDTGIPVSEYIPVLCEHLRGKEMKTETYRIARQLLDAVEDNPVDVVNWGDARDELHRQVEQLEGDDIDKQLGSDRLELVADTANRIEKLYRRA